MASRVFHRLSWVLGLGLLVALLAAAFVPGCPFSFYLPARGTAYNLMLHVVMIIVLFRGAVWPSRTDRALGLFLWSIALLCAVLIGYLLFFEPKGPMRNTATVVSQQLSIPWALGAFAFFSRFRYADVFVKQGLALVAAGGMALLGAILTGSLITRGSWQPEPMAYASTLVGLACLFCLAMLAFLFLTRSLDLSVDRWLFRRPDYVRLLAEFSEEIEKLSDEKELFRQASQWLRQALGGNDLSFDPAEDEHTPLLDEPERLLWTVPVNAEGATKAVLSIRHGERGRMLLSEEIAFLELVAERLGRRLLTQAHERENREGELRETRLKELLAHAELKALRAQVDPHFLFNTLNTILDLIHRDPEKAEVVTEQLAGVFRILLAKRDQDWATVDEEFGFLRQVLEIERVRFGESLRVHIDLDPAVGAERIPALILQPLVENAIKHGVAPKVGGGHLTLQAIDRGTSIRFLVQDDGVGFKASTKNGAPGPRDAGVGLGNVRDRLQTAYGASAILRIEHPESGGARAIIDVPKLQARDTTSGTDSEKKAQ